MRTEFKLSTEVLTAATSAGSSSSDDRRNLYLIALLLLRLFRLLVGAALLPGRSPAGEMPSTREHFSPIYMA